MPLEKQELLEMRVEARRKIKKEFAKYRGDYLAEMSQLARKGQLRQGVEQGIEEAAAPGREEESAPPITDIGY
jgi:hypothetical protein